MPGLESPWDSSVGREGEAGEDNWFQEEPKDEMDDADWNSDNDAPSSVEDLPAYPRNPSQRRALAVLSQSLLSQPIQEFRERLTEKFLHCERGNVQHK